MKFSVGDKIERTTPHNRLVVGGIYTVKRVSNRVTLELEEETTELYDANNFKLVTDSFSVGDKVRLKGGKDLWTVTSTRSNGMEYVGLDIKLDNETVALKIAVAVREVELVERAIKYVDKDFWIIVYSDGSTGAIFENEVYAKGSGKPSNCDSVQKITLRVPVK